MILNELCNSIIKKIVTYRHFNDIYDHHPHLLNLLDLVWLDPEIFSQAIHAKGAPLTQCWGFVDGTVGAIARPICNQRIMYSGHKRMHYLKFQVLEKIDGSAFGGIYSSKYCPHYN